MRSGARRLPFGKLHLVSDGDVDILAEPTAGRCYFREAGVEHDAINANDLEFVVVFMEIEFK